MLEAGAPPEQGRFGVMEHALAGTIPWDFPPYPHEMRGDDVELSVFAIRCLGGSILSWTKTAATHQLHDHPHRDRYAGGRIMVREGAGPTPVQIARESGRWGQELRSEIREVFGRHVTLGAFCEQLVRDENRVTLSKDVRMPNGDPAARVDFKLVSEYEDLGFRKMRDVIVSILDELGAEDVRVLVRPSNSGHFMGGHRMGNDPDTSTTDSYLESHEVKGLYLAGGGAFPTSGISNPTLTSVALVLRAVDHMLGR